MINKSLNMALRCLLSTIFPLIISSEVCAQNEGTILRLIVTDSVNHIKRGTGFVVANHNYIITAYHVVQNAKNIAIDRPQSMDTSTLEVLGYATDTDIALLKLPIEIMSKVVPFRYNAVHVSSSKSPITLIGYGSVIDRPQKYTGYHENAPFVLSEEWNRPKSIRGNSSRLFNIAGVKLLMLQAPTPYGVSGGPVINPAGEVIGMTSGALTRIENVTSLGWAIPINYALHDVSQLHGKQASNVTWPALKLITDENILMRAFGGPQISLIDNLSCPDNLKDISTAWGTTANAIAEFQGYLMSARVAIDVMARQANSRKDARDIMITQMSLLKERFNKIRNDLSAYKQKIVVANINCNRDIEATMKAIERLPETDHNIQLKKGVKKLGMEIVSNVNAITKESTVKAEYELRKQWKRIASIEPLSDDGSSILSRPSQSIESDIHLFLQFIEAMEYIVQNAYLGVYNDIYRELESVLDSYRLWIDSANRQPWDRS